MSLVILNFHGIGIIPRQIDNGERDCWLELEHFEAVLDLAQKLPHVLLTFDDGNISDLKLGLPALLRRGLTASFFVCSKRLDNPAFLSRDDVRKLQAQGMRIGSHGSCHRNWRRLSCQELTAELSKSRLDLEDVCGIPVLEAACPFGEYDRKVLRALRSAGYRKVYTSDRGWTNSSSWLQPRNTVLRNHSIDYIGKLIKNQPNWATQMVRWTRRVLKQIR
jgi:peptidoglycan/xylan/chitin deacetylase (PgdA/CDA1 family)